MAGSSTASVVAALSANSVVTVAKFVGFGFSGSGAMLSEAIHSAADTANQSLLLLGLKRAVKPKNRRHPYGYGRARFFWGLVSALGIFFLGAGVTLWHGVHGLLHPSPSDHGWISWVVLSLSFVLEFGALIVAVRGTQREAAAVGISTLQYAKEARDPTLAAVLMEDGAACLGLLLAIGGIALEQLTGWPGWDALASISIGVLLALVALFLIASNRVFLIGRAIDEEIFEQVEEVLEANPAVEKLNDLRGVVLNIGQYKIAADVDFDGRILADKLLDGVDMAALAARLQEPEALRSYLRQYAEEVVEALGDEVDALEAQIQERVPGVSDMDIETE